MIGILRCTNEFTKFKQALCHALMPGPVFCQEPGSRRQDTLPPKSRFESYPAEEALDQIMSVTALPVLFLTVPVKVGLPLRSVCP
jgi:hypothetical protein